MPEFIGPLQPPRNISLAVDAFDAEKIDEFGQRPFTEFLKSNLAQGRVSSLLLPDEATLDFHYMDIFRPFMSGHADVDRAGVIHRTPSYPIIVDSSLSGGYQAMREYVRYVVRHYPAHEMAFTFALGVTDMAVRSVVDATQVWLQESAEKNHRPMKQIDFLLTGVLPEDPPAEIRSIFKKQPLSVMRDIVGRARNLGLAGVVGSAEYARAARGSGVQYIGSGVNLTGESYISTGGVEKRATPYSRAVEHCTQVVVGHFISDHPDGPEVGLRSLSA